jgi:hypothetical protein
MQHMFALLMHLAPATLYLLAAGLVVLAVMWRSAVSVQALQKSDEKSRKDK